jgi:hypothetical protein
VVPQLVIDAPPATNHPPPAAPASPIHRHRANLCDRTQIKFSEMLLREIGRRRLLLSISKREGRKGVSQHCYGGCAVCSSASNGILANVLNANYFINRWCRKLQRAWSCKLIEIRFLPEKMESEEVLVLSSSSNVFLLI